MISLDGTNYVYEELNFIGAYDTHPVSLSYDPAHVENSQAIKASLNDNLDDDLFNIFLFHRPNYLELICAADLTFSGHVHGGQWQAPFDWFAAISPDQGIFPEYFKGLYECDNGNVLIVSAGTQNLKLISHVFITRVTYQLLI